MRSSILGFLLLISGGPALLTAGASRLRSIRRLADSGARRRDNPDFLACPEVQGVPRIFGWTLDARAPIRALRARSA